MNNAQHTRTLCCSAVLLIKIHSPVRFILLDLDLKLSSWKRIVSCIKVERLIRRIKMAGIRNIAAG